MRSFDLVSAELVAFELLALLFPLVLLAALYFVVRGGPGRPRRRRSTGATPAERSRGRIT
jgi:hypothetical protein